ncbi:MAG: prepilin-type N-terminal cleavage/methylation domain-containing protein [Planctomycetota bacterium]
MRSTSSHDRGNRRGLTLIELVVVLTILVALGSLLVPIIGNALTRSHVATCATNIPEISKALIFAQATSGDFGDGWTTGVFGAGADAPNPVNAVVGLANTDGDPTTVVTLAAAVLTADEAAALNDLGINNVFNHGDPTLVDGYDVTFNNGLTGVPLDDTVPIITLTIEQVDGLSLPAAGANQKYVWLGIDKSWTQIGTITPEPPVHFGDTPGAYPNEVYSRFGAIFLLEDDPAITGDGAASFQMVSYNLTGDDAFETADNHIAIHWDEVQE